MAGAVRTFWIVNLVVCEWLVWPLAIHSCTWPSGPNPLAESRFLLLSDPQLTDHSSYGGITGTKRWVYEFYNDVYLW